MNNTCQKRWFCFSSKTLSITTSKNSSLDDEILEDYCETNLDDILHLKRTFSLDKSPRKIKPVRSSATIQTKKHLCCMTKFCQTNKTQSKRKVKQFIPVPPPSSIEQCRYCSSESSLSQWDKISHHSLQLYHAVELYLSSNDHLSDCSSFFSQHTRTIMEENQQLNLCEINEIIYAIHSDIEDEHERNETLDALASSLREVADDLPMNIDDNERAIVHEPPPGLGQILVRAVMYEIVMRLFSFYLLILLCFGYLS